MIPVFPSAAFRSRADALTLPHVGIPTTHIQLTRRSAKHGFERTAID